MSERTYTITEEIKQPEAAMRFHELRGYLGTAYAQKHDLRAKHHREAILRLLGIAIEETK